MNSILLYGPIFSFTAELFILALEQSLADTTDKIRIRMNTPGGSPFAGWGMVAVVKEHNDRIDMLVDGTGDSMGAYILLYLTDVEALNTSRFRFHRADGFVDNEADRLRLDGINKDLRAAMEEKLNIPRFEKIAGVTLDEFFNGEERVEVELTAKQAKFIGLIKNVINLADVDVEALKSEKFVALYNTDTNAKPTPKKNNPTKTKNDKMTLDEFKAEHPELFATIVALGITQEKDRTGSWLAYSKIDSKAVIAGIEGGEKLSQTDMAKFNVAAMSPEALKKIEEESADSTKTEEVEEEKSDSEKEVDAFEAEVDANLKTK